MQNQPAVSRACLQEYATFPNDRIPDHFQTFSVKLANGTGTANTDDELDKLIGETSSPREVIITPAEGPGSWRTVL